MLLGRRWEGAKLSMAMHEDPRIADQIAYYDALARDYGDLVSGDRGSLSFDSFASLVFQGIDLPEGTCLELACGAGVWTKFLARHFQLVTAVDASPGMLALARHRLVGSEKVSLVQADLFQFHPDRQFDFIFAAFWLSHVPRARLAAFWEIIDSALKQGGHALFVDSYTSGMTGSGEIRRLPDGREFKIVKEAYQGDELPRLLGTMGWQAEHVAISENTYRILARRATEG